MSRIAREEKEKEEPVKRKHTFKENKKKKGHSNRKVVHRVLSALEQVNLSDVDTDSEEDATPKTKQDLIGLCLMASRKSSTNDGDLESDENNEVEPSYDDLLKAVAKLGTLLEKRNKKIAKHDILIESLHTENARLKSLIPADDSCKQCDIVYAEFTSLRDVHASTLEQLKAEKDKNKKHVCATEPTFYEKCKILELKLKDAMARVEQLKNDFLHSRDSFLLKLPQTKEANV